MLEQQLGGDKQHTTGGVNAEGADASEDTDICTRKESLPSCELTGGKIYYVWAYHTKNSLEPIYTGK